MHDGKNRYRKTKVWAGGPVLADQPQVVVHQRPDGEDVRGVHSRTHNLQPATGDS